MSMLSLFDPKVLLVLVLVLMGACYKSYTYGVDVESARQAKLNAVATKVAYDLRDKAIEAGQTMTAKLMDLNKKTEGDLAKEREEIGDLRRANGRLVAAHGGLYDKNGRATGHPAAAAGPGSADAGGAGTAAPGCSLSQSVTDDLLDFARDADDVVAIARACKAHVVELHQLFQNSCVAVVSRPPSE